jgi:transmembrane sensor
MGVALFSPYGWYGLSSTYLTAKGEHQIIALSDGSSVELNTDSEIQVRYRFNQRQVDLVRGEAFFNVIHNAERPFLVAVSNLTIHDIGTAFNVYKKNQKVAIAVQEGVVDVNTKLGLRRLNAGQQIAYSNDEGFESLGQLDLDASTAWRQGKLLFRGQRLADVLAEIGRYHDIEIHLPNAKIADLQVSGSFRAEQLDNMLNAVSTLLPVNIKRISEKEVLIEANLGFIMREHDAFHIVQRIFRRDYAAYQKQKVPPSYCDAVHQVDASIHDGLLLNRMEVVLRAG